MGAADAVRRAYDLIARSHGQQIIDIAGHPLARTAGGALSVIADDSDYHRTRRGLMVYPSIALCVFGSHDPWVLAYGHKGGSYPGSEYASDLMTFRYHLSKGDQFPLTFDDIEFEQLVTLTGDKNDWFRSSLLTVMSDGRLKVRQKRITELLEPSLDEYILSSEPNYGIRLFSGGEEKVELGDSHQYRRDFPGVLAGAIRHYLDEQSVRTARGQSSALQTT